MAHLKSPTAKKWHTDLTQLLHPVWLTPVRRDYCLVSRASNGGACSASLCCYSTVGCGCGLTMEDLALPSWLNLLRMHVNPLHVCWRATHANLLGCLPCGGVQKQYLCQEQVHEEPARVMQCTMVFFRKQAHEGSVLVSWCSFNGQFAWWGCICDAMKCNIN